MHIVHRAAVARKELLTNERPAHDAVTRRVKALHCLVPVGLRARINDEHLGLRVVAQTDDLLGCNIVHLRVVQYEHAFGREPSELGVKLGVKRKICKGSQHNNNGCRLSRAYWDANTLRAAYLHV